jgi:hypothetical protein
MGSKTMLDPEAIALAEHVLRASVHNDTIQLSVTTLTTLATALLRLENQYGELIESRAVALSEMMRLRRMVEAANNAALLCRDSADESEVEHQISSHAETLPQYVRELAKALRAVQGVVCLEVVQMVEKEGPYAEPKL